MDGNRRYAKKNCVAKKEGHVRGFDKLAETLQWCLHLGIKEVTVYAFSLDNFKRTQEEIDALFDLAREKFKRLLEEKDKLNEHGVCINVIGNIKKLPDDLVKLIAESMLITKQNNKTFLNVAFSYTGHDELTNAFNQISNGIKNNDLEESDLSVEILDNCMYTYPSPPPDLLIRTSVLWPEFTAWDFMIAIFMYQRNVRAFIRYKLPSKRLSSRAEKFVENVQQNRLNSLYTIA
jgi:ditrans,polycis-polyprenyl diphosphate synthase